MNKPQSMFNNNLTPMFNGSVLMNKEALQDQAVINMLENEATNSFKFRGTWYGEGYNISDRD